MSEEIKQQLKSIFQKALAESEDLVAKEMYDPSDFMKELEEYVDYINHDVIDCLDVYMAEDDQERDIASEKADAWYDNFKNGD